MTNPHLEAARLEYLRVIALASNESDALQAAIQAHTAAVLRGTEAGEMVMRLTTPDGPPHHWEPSALELEAAALIESLTAALAVERGKVETYQRSFREAQGRGMREVCEGYERDIAGLKARLALVEPLVKAALEFHCVRTVTAFDSPPMWAAANKVSDAVKDLASDAAALPQDAPQDDGAPSTKEN